MRDTFVKTLIELAKENKNIELLTGDLGFGVLKPYWETVPESVYQCRNRRAEHDNCCGGNGIGGENSIYILYRKLSNSAVS